MFLDVQGKGRYSRAVLARALQRPEGKARVDSHCTVEVDTHCTARCVISHSWGQDGGSLPPFGTSRCRIEGGRYSHSLHIPSVANDLQ